MTTRYTTLNARFEDQPAYIFTRGTSERLTLWEGDFYPFTQKNEWASGDMAVLWAQMCEDDPVDWSEGATIVDLGSVARAFAAIDVSELGERGQAAHAELARFFAEAVEAGEAVYVKRE